ncbi:protein TRANSPARENT TESTA 9-like isoform X3 [Vigna angularis]|uniref:protein TRANSPARENT TESTA 9-like isoform X3 n=1 Tax=Phaseolus angularis TaxID=3914 RepID=UPI0022B4FC01|nr:protein TRANSPARENT TESTA 9-like isoform X3 [Vigna angularis]
MLRSLWRSTDRFSVQNFQHVINELRMINVVDKSNRELVMDLLQSVVEIVMYGDRQDPQIFECFMERQVLEDFVHILKISEDSKIQAPLLQYLSIMIQNMDSEHSIYYCFSNGYINNIISHPFKFDGQDLAPYYVSFLRAISSKINRDTLCLLVDIQGDAVVSFPLYTGALRFAQHEEKMIQTAIRAIVLNIYNVSDDKVYQFISTPPVSEYFSDLICRLKDLCFRLDAFVNDKDRKMDTQKRRNGIILESEKIADELYYFKDILRVGKPRLTILVMENLLNGLVFPLLCSFMASKNKNGSDLSAITSLYIISRLLQVVGGRSTINNVAFVLLYHILNFNVKSLSEGNTSDFHYDIVTFSKCLNEVENVISSASESNGSQSINGTYLGAHWEGFMSSINIYNPNGEICSQRSGIFAFLFCKDQSLLLASIFLLLILIESKDLDCDLSLMSKLSEMGDEMTHGTTSKTVDGSIFVKFIPEILKALLNVLAFQQPLSTMMLWHAGWCLQKLLVFHKMELDSDNLLLFTTSYDQSRVKFMKELEGVWLDHIPDTLIAELESCKRVLEQPTQYKDPLFMLELVLHQQPTNGQRASYFSWHRMVDVVKAFVLHIQLRTFIFKGALPEKPLLNMISSSTNDSGVIRSSNISSASFGSNVSLEYGLPCGISFSNSEIRDIYVIPVASGIVGKLLLAEKHPFRSRHGVVIAIAPLAGLCPKIDEQHSSWLHLRIREFDPQFYSIKGRGNQLSMPDHYWADGRWTLGFPNARACEEAQLAILNEMGKQRSAVEYMLAPLLEDDFGLAQN